MRALFSMAQLDAQAFGGAVARLEERRARGMAHLARRLAEQGVLRPGLSRRRAADLLWVITSFDAFDLLYTGRGLSTAEVARFLVAAAEQGVCN